MASLNPPATRKARGFTITEMAVVLVIVALLIGGMILPLSAQDDVRRINETQATLKISIEALSGFAAINGRLPCPATATSNGIEAPSGGGSCTLFNASDVVPVGFLPGATLGLAPLDSSGRVLDAWGNPIRYGVTNGNSSALTTTESVKSLGIENLSPTQLIVCPSAIGGIQNAGTLTANCPTGITAFTTNALAVVYSLGKNAGIGGTGTDERQNPNPNISSATLPSDSVFISHLPAPASSPGGEFDDIMVWLSPNVFFFQMNASSRWNK